MSRLSDAQVAALSAIENPDMRAAALYLAKYDCKVLTPFLTYQIGSERFTERDLVALVCAHAMREDAKNIQSPTFAQHGVTRYQQIVGITPVTLELRESLCRTSPNSTEALRMAREIAMWSRVAGPPVERAEEREAHLEEASHLILRWVENCKRRILGMQMDGRQLMLDCWGRSGAFKSATVRALLRPLGGLAHKTNAPMDLFVGHEGVWASQYVAIWLDEFPPLPKFLLPQLKDFIFSDTWRANSKNKDAMVLPMLASLIATHNPTPDEQFPDDAMARRLGAIHYPCAMDPVRGYAFVDDVIDKFDMVSFWRAVDPVQRASDDTVVARAFRRNDLRDVFDHFLLECVSKDDKKTVLLQEVLDAFLSWGRAGNWNTSGWNSKRVAERLRSHGYHLPKVAKGRIIRGITLDFTPPGSAEEAV